MSERYRIEDGSRFRLSAIDPGDTGEYAHHDEADPKLAADLKRLAELHELFYVDRRFALLVVLQGMDTSGKDGTIKHVFDALDPLGVVATAFKAPTSDELARPFLWRIDRHVPPRGHIAIFNRSHYEDVLVARVHGLVPPAVWRRRYGQIAAWESYLAENGVVVLKFFLHISKHEQKERLLARLADPEKRWKFDPNDLAERKRWGSYQRAYQDAIRNCSAPHAPWYVVPANKKWYRNLVVADAIVRTLTRLRLRHPEPDFDPRRIKVV